MSSNLSRSERETIIILTDDGTVTVSSNSPSRQKEIEARLGPPTYSQDGYWRWDSTHTHISIALPKRRRGGPRVMTPEHLAAMAAGREAARQRRLG